MSAEESPSLPSLEGGRRTSTCTAVCLELGRMIGAVRPRHAFY